MCAGGKKGRQHHCREQWRALQHPCDCERRKVMVGARERRATVQRHREGEREGGEGEGGEEVKEKRLTDEARPTETSEMSRHTLCTTKLHAADTTRTIMQELRRLGSLSFVYYIGAARRYNRPQLLAFPQRPSASAKGSSCWAAVERAARRAGPGAPRHPQGPARGSRRRRSARQVGRASPAVAMHVSAACKRTREAGSEWQPAQQACAATAPLRRPA